MSKFIIRYGDSGNDVKFMQELLNDNKIFIDINGKYDDKMKDAVQKFQVSKQLKDTSGKVIDTDDYLLLIKPLELAKARTTKVSDISEMVVVYAYRHLALEPHDIGGINCGPWVRLYCNGVEGFKYSWDCGFISYILKQSYETMQMKNPLLYETHRHRLINNAKQRGLFHYSKVTQHNPDPGNIVFVRDGNEVLSTIVVKSIGKKILTIELDYNSKVLTQRLRVLDGSNTVGSIILEKKE